jgi:uncharacterized protein YukE
VPEKPQGDRTQINVPEFMVAHQKFDYEVADLRDLVYDWRVLGEFPQPLGDNPVGRAVADRFVDMSGQFVGTLGDYGGKLGDAQRTIGEVARSSTEMDDAVATAFNTVLGHLAAQDSAEARQIYRQEVTEILTALRYEAGQASSDWTAAGEHDWRAYSSKELHDFANIGNNPAEVFDSVARWQSNTDALKNSTANFTNNVGQLMSAWQGAAANAAQGALVPLVKWGDTAAGNADRLQANLRKAGEAALHLKTMPGPVDEPSFFDMLLTHLSGSPAAIADMHEQVRHANAVKEQQVRHMEQYEGTMATVYTELPDYHVAPGAVANPPSPGGTNPGHIGGGLPGGGTLTPGATAPRSRRPAAAAVRREAEDNRAKRAAAHRTPAQTTASGAVDTRSARDSRSTSGLLIPAASSGSTQERGGSALGSGVGRFGSGLGEGHAGRLGEARGGRGMTPTGRTTTPTEPAPTPGPRRGPGTTPVGPQNNRRVEEEEDSEHQRPSYLVERDPQGTFGTDERTAPPVIG